MFLEIDHKKKTPSLKVHLAKPNKQIISVIQEKYNATLSIRLSDINELSFDIPYVIEGNENPNIDLIKELMLIRIQLGSYTEWYTIDEIIEKGEDTDVMTIKCFSLGYELKRRMFVMEEESIGMVEFLENVLKDTTWRIGYIHPQFENMYRAISVDSNSLDAIVSGAETFGYVLGWNTINRTISFHRAEDIGKFRGLTISYGRFLESITRNRTSEELVTRFFVEGSEGLTINRVNPTGNAYLEDFTYFMHPFERDTNKNVLQHSHFMSDELCHAILDNKEIVEQKTPQIKTYSDQLLEKNVQLVLEDSKLTQLELELDTILNLLDVAHAAEDEVGISTQKVNRDEKQREISDQKTVVETLEYQIAIIQGQIELTQDEIAIKSNFTPELQDELKLFIIEGKFQDDRYIDEQELYDDAVKKFEEIRMPKTVIDVDIANLLNIIEEQYYHDKISLGDKVKIKYKPMNLEYTASIIEVNYDFEEGSANLVIANTNDLLSDMEKLTQLLYSNSNASSLVEANKYKWDKILGVEEDVTGLLTNEWNAVKQKITAGINNEIEFGKRGIIVRNPSSPNEIIIIQSGVIACSDDNGENWKTAMTAQGIVAERLLGRIIAGENLLITNNSGSFLMDNDGAWFDVKSFKVSSSSGSGGTGGEGEKNLVDNWNSAKDFVDQYTDDNILSAYEKKMTEKEWTTISENYSKYMSQLEDVYDDKEEDVLEVIAYKKAYADLFSYLYEDTFDGYTLLAPEKMNEPTIIDGEFFDELFKVYDRAEWDLKNIISQKTQNITEIVSEVMEEVNKSLEDLSSEIHVGHTPPEEFSEGTPWLDTAQKMLKVYANGEWVQSADWSGDFEELLSEINGINSTLGNMSNDNILDINERQVIKDKLTEILGYVIENTDEGSKEIGGNEGTLSLPTYSDLDASFKGDLYSIRAYARLVGVPINDITYIAVATKYTSLKSYLDAMIPIKPWDASVMNQAKNIAVTNSTFRNTWVEYCQAINDLVATINEKANEVVEPDEPIDPTPTDGKYVNGASGSNSNGGTFSSPWKTVQYAVDNAQVGDVIYIMNGTYNERVIIKKSGEAAKPITLKNYPDHTPVIDGSGITWSSGNGWGGLINTGRHSNWIIEGLEVVNSNGVGIGEEYYSGSTLGSQNIIVKDCTVTNTRGPAVIFFLAKNITVDGVIATDVCKGGNSEGISMWRVDGFEIKNCTVINSWKEYYDAKDGCKNGSIHDCIAIETNTTQLEGEGRPAFYVDAYSQAQSNIEVYNNIASVPDSVGFCTGIEEGGSLIDITFRNNIAYDCQRGYNVVAYASTGLPYTMSNITLKNNVDFNSQWTSCFINAKVTNLMIFNNIFFSTGTSVPHVYDTGVTSLAQLTIRNNLYRSTTTGTNYPIGTNYLVNNNATAIFVDPNGNPRDFHLKAGSPAMGAGYNGVDMGAYGDGGSTPAIPDPEPTNNEIFLVNADSGFPITGWSSYNATLALDTTNKYLGHNTLSMKLGGDGLSGPWYKLENGVDYAYSVMMKVDKSFVGDGWTPLNHMAGLNNADESKISFTSYNTSYGVGEVGTYKLFHITFKLTGDANSFQPWIYYSSTLNGNANIAYLRLEKGSSPTVPTGWEATPTSLGLESMFSGIETKASVPIEVLTNIGLIGQRATDTQSALQNMGSDSILNFSERQIIKSKIAEILGYTTEDPTPPTGTTASLPTYMTLDSTAKGDFYAIRKSAQQIGISTSDPKYIAVATKYTALRSYLNSMTPVMPWDTSVTNSEKNITVVKSTFRDTWLEYYQAVNDLAVAINTKAKDNVENLQIGTKNLIRNSGMPVTSNSYNIQDYPLTETLTEGTEVTISLKGTLGVGKEYFGIYNSGGNVSICTLSPTDKGVDGIFKKTTTWKVGTSTNTYLRVYHMPNTVTGVESTIEWIKLERGNKATDWSPAPEDILVNVEMIEQRVTDVEFSITEDNIVSTIRESTSYQTDMSSKANTVDLENYVSGAELEQAQNNLQSDLNNAMYILNESISEITSSIAQSSANWIANFKNSGGVNIIRNSIGMGKSHTGFSNWTFDGYGSTSIIQINDVDLSLIGFSSGFGFISSSSGKSIIQDISLIVGQTYTLSFYIKKTNNSPSSGDVYFVIVDDKIVTKASKQYTSTYVTNGYEFGSLTFTATSDMTKVRVYAGANAVANVTGLMLNIGSQPLKWSLADGELYNGSTMIDIEGVHVSLCDEEGVEKGYSLLGSDGVSIHYDTDGDGILEKVFYFEKDGMVTKKAEIQEEFSMGMFKMVNVPDKGWALVKR